MSDSESQSDLESDSKRSMLKHKNRFKRPRKLRRCLLNSVLIFIVFGITATLVFLFSDDTDHTNDPIIPTRRPSVKKVLIWNPDYAWNLPVHNCKNRNCYVDFYGMTADPVHEFDAVILNPMDNVSSFLHRYHINTRNQSLVYANRATNMNTTKLVELSSHQFNLTMTYRLDSDIIWNDFEVRKIRPVSKSQRIAPTVNPVWEDYSSYLPIFRSYIPDLLKTTYKNRTNFAITRTCGNTTLDASTYKELKNYIFPPAVIKVDSLCQPTWSFFRMPWLQNHKFVLIFEDVLCTDNISRIFYIALLNGIVPVVMGGSEHTNYSNFAPPHSYILASEFPSMRELAEYLTHLDEDPNAYVEYQWWRHFYKIEVTEMPLCQLCDMLNDITDQGQKRIVNRNWWNKYQCDKTSH